MILKGTFLSKKAKEYFTKNWNKKVMSIAIGKAPINQEYETILNILTNGDLKKQLKK